MKCPKCDKSCKRQTTYTEITQEVKGMAAKKYRVMTVTKCPDFDADQAANPELYADPQGVNKHYVRAEEKEIEKGQIPTDITVQKMKVETDKDGLTHMTKKK